MLEPQSFTTSSKGSITSSTCGRQYTDMSKMSYYEFTKTKLHQFTPSYSPNPTRSCINWPHRTLHHYTTRQPIHPYHSMQSYRLPYDKPMPDKKTATVAIHLFLEIMLKFGFLQILPSDNRTEFKSKLVEHFTQQFIVKKTYLYPPDTPKPTEN